MWLEGEGGGRLRLCWDDVICFAGREIEILGSLVSNTLEEKRYG